MAGAKLGFDHIGMSFDNIDDARTMHTTLLESLGYSQLKEYPEYKVYGFGPEGEQPSFWIWKCPEGEKPSHSVHVAFKAKSHEQIEDFHKKAIQAGFKDNGAPGPRPMYGEAYWAAFVKDRQGNNIEAVCK